MSTLLPKERFASPQRNYSLLPFRFHRMPNGSVLVTSLAGDYLVVSRSNFESLIDGTLDHAGAAYMDLEARGILLSDPDSVHKELLAVRLRTKLAPLTRFTSLHMFVVTLRCNHACSYCQVSRRDEDVGKFDMSIDTARLAVNVALSSPSPAIKIEFQGGEPLLNFAAVEFITNYATETARRLGKTVSFVIATNLSKVTDDILAFCQSNRVEISTSLDGPKDLHDLNRPMIDEDSFDSVASGIEKARRMLGPHSVSALMTTTEHSLGRVKEIIDTYVNMGFPGIFLRPLSPYGFAIKTRAYRKYDTKRWLDFFDEGLDYVLDLNKQGVQFNEFYSSVILKKILTPFSPGYVDLMSPSGIGISGVIYNYDGSVYASDEGRMRAEMGDKTFHLGNVNSDSYADIFTSDALLDPLERSFAASVPMCSDCALEPFCGAEPVYHHATQGDFVGLKPASGFCERNTHVIERLIDILEKDGDEARILRQWSVMC